MDPISHEFDVIILGTGLVQSMLAGAIGRAGRSVLHIDSNPFYGEGHASLNLKEFIEHLSAQTSKEGTPYCNLEAYVHIEPQPQAEEFESRLLVGALDSQQSINGSAPISFQSLFDPGHEALRVALDNVKSAGPLVEDRTDSENCIAALLDVLSNHRRFNIELSPKAILSSGPVVELLISSGVGRYLEFKALEEVYIFDGVLEQMPGAKEDIFSNDKVSLLDKRRLMKFLTMALNYESGLDGLTEIEDTLLADYLESQKFNEKLKSILYVLAGVHNTDQIDTVSTGAALRQIQLYLRSVGRFGKTPFLSCLYGAGSELCQAFCRLSAVYGGIYMLQQQVERVEFAKTTERVSVAINGSTYNSSSLIASPEYLQASDTRQPELYSRAVVIVKHSIRPPQSLLSIAFPRNSIGNANSISVIQQSFDTGAAPQPYYVVYLITKATGTATQDLENCVTTLLQASPALADSEGHLPPSATPLLSLYFQEYVYPGFESWVDDRVVVVGNHFDHFSLESAPENAASIFQKLYPDESFLPPLPNPEDESD
ncbi:GDP dissociation inhibitor [Polychytrium aggregatum]|uniref:GDP dissociation inhibitor n=1 Tax=Polychytrium aggregatum TaxID=110093 RepID=UPI0022FEC38B|nr:GDP dissociation inhibitor [Polychytrium aggregatum]KAI9209856.1 GDP dissociation inhibitor [Polychytrium aggregatum]